MINFLNKILKFILFTIILFIIIDYNNSFSIVFKNIKISNQEVKTINLDFPSNLACIIPPYEGRVKIIDKNLERNLNNFLISSNFKHNGEYQETILFSDDKGEKIRANHIHFYGNLKIKNQLNDDFQEFSPYCLYFPKKSQIIYLTRQK